MDENRANEQNERMREWFKQRTGLKTGLLSVHMKEIDRLLKENSGEINSGKCPKCGTGISLHEKEKEARLSKYRASKF